MKTFLTSILFLFCFLPYVGVGGGSASAQKLTVESFTLAQNDISAQVHERKDLNGVNCALVKVGLGLTGCQFEGGVMGTVENKTGEYWVYMPKGNRCLKIKHQNYAPIMVTFADYGIEKLESNRTYVMTVSASGNAQSKRQILNIKVTPSDAIVVIDGDVEERRQIELTEGSHSYNVAASGYYPQSGEIRINANAPAKLVVELDRKSSATTNVAQNVTSQSSAVSQSATSISSPVVIKGKVTDGKDAIVGASILEAGTENGAVSDLDGNFSLKVSNPNATLKVSFVGYPTEEIKLNGRTSINVVLTNAVDLGLSVNWSVWNLGATKPEDYGNYYAWGETKTKSNYSWSTYFDSKNNLGTLFNKYYNRGGKTTLDPEDDAAHVIWDDNWRMPTDAEMTELRTQCTWMWTTLNGVNGYRVTGRNGNSIFLPAAGYYRDGTIFNQGELGDYWTKTLDMSNNQKAYGLFFKSNRADRLNGERSLGLTIRLVCTR